MGMLAYMTWYFEGYETATWETFENVKISAHDRVVYVDWWCDN